MRAPLEAASAAIHGAGNGSAGLGLVEVLFAIVITSVGILGASAIVLGITSQARRASWHTDHTLAGRGAMDSLTQAGFAAAVSGSGDAYVGGRRCDLSFDVTSRSPQLKHVRLTATSANAPETALETILSRPRPLPAAP